MTGSETFPGTNRLGTRFAFLRSPLSDRATWTLAAFLLGVHAILAWWGRLPGILTQQDDARYILLGRALRSFAYHDLHTVGTPAHHLYPPGYPGVLGVWSLIFGESVDGFIVLNILLSLGTLTLLFVALRRLWSVEVALLSLAALATNPYQLDLVGQVRSEMLFVFLTVSAMVAVSLGRPRTLTFIAAGAATILAALTRTIGVAAVLALGLHWLMERRLRVTVVYATGATLLVGAWLWWSFAPAEQHLGASYAADFLSTVGSESDAPSRVAVLAGRVIYNVPRYLVRVLPYQLPLPVVPGTRIDNLLHVAIVPLALAAGIASLYRGWRPTALLLLIYGGVLAIWPWNSARFVAPLLALLVPAFLLGIAWITAKISRPWGPPSLRIAAVLLIGWGAVGSLDRAVALAPCDRGVSPPGAGCTTVDQASYLEAVRYVERALPRDARFLTMKPEPLYYYTGRQSVARETAMTVDSASFLPFLRDVGIDYVLAGNLQQWETWLLPRRLQGICEHLAVEAQFSPGTYLFRLRAPAGEPTDENACSAVADYWRANANLRFEDN